MASNALFSDKVDQISPDILIISMRNDYEKVNWDTYLTVVKGIERVIVLGPSPEINTKDLIYKNREVITNYDYMAKTDEFMRANEALSKRPNIEYISMRELLCSDINRCDFFIDDQLIYADEGHFSKAGSSFVVDKILSNRILEWYKKY